MQQNIEHGIKPLVDALNNTGMVKTFSSCEGHYTIDEQVLQDRNKADVRFDPCENILLTEIEHFITYLITSFEIKFSFSPITFISYKLYCPNDSFTPDFLFVFELKPFNRFSTPDEKKRNTNKAIIQLSRLVEEYMLIYKKTSQS